VPVCETLEDRRLFSTIHWANEGTATSDTDGFNAVFQANAPAARAVVSAALMAWQRIITNFNYSDPSLDDTYQMTISMSTSTSNNLGGYSNATAFDSSGKPTAGSMTLNLGPDVHGSQWWLDPTPNDSSEFTGGILGPFTARAGPNVNGGDLFSTVAHEMGHCLGFLFSPQSALQINANGYLANTGVSDPDQTPGVWWTFTGPDVNALLTTDEGGAMGSADNLPAHMSEIGFSGVAASYVNPTTHVAYYEGRDLMVPAGSFGRQLPSLMDALILKDAYGYTITPPQTFGTFYANYNATTRQVVINGGQQSENNPYTPSNDVINISANANTLFVSVSIGSPVPGNGPVQPYMSQFPLSSVSSILVQGSDGNDVVNYGLGNTSSLPGITVNGGGGNDTLNVDDSADPTSRGVTLKNASAAGYGAITGLAAGEIDYKYAETSQLTVKTGPGAGNVDVHATGTKTSIVTNSRVQAFTGTAVNIGDSGSVQGILGTLKIADATGAPIPISVDDSADGGPQDVILGNASTAGFGAITGLVPSPAEIDYQYANTGSLLVSTGLAANTVSVVATGVPTTVSTGVSKFIGGSLAVNVGDGTLNSILQPLTVQTVGLAASDTVTVNDSADPAARALVLSTSPVNSQFGRLTGMPASGAYVDYEYGPTTQLTTKIGSGANTVNVHATGTTPTTFTDGLILALLKHVGGVAKSFQMDAGAAATLSRLTITGGTGGGINGGIDNRGTMTVTGSSIHGNSASFNGGGILNSGNLTLTHSTVSGNTATGDGGGIENLHGGTLTLIDSAVTGNVSHGNGGAVNNQGTLTVTNCTFSGNRAASGGGALFNINDASATLANSILWGDSGSTGEIANNAVDGSAVHAQYSDVQGGWPGTGNLNLADPGFVSSSNFQLQSTSPCINTGQNSLVVNDPTDLAGLPRIASGIVDMGAYEYQGALPPATLVMVQGPPNTIPVGGTFSIIVDIERNGHRTADTYPVTLTVYKNPDAVQYIPVNAVAGEVVFANISLNQAGTYSVRASDAYGDTPIASGNFTVTAVGSTPNLVFATQPSNVAAGQYINPPVVVDVMQDGQILTTDNSLVAISVAGGTYTVQAHNGVATFNNIAISTPGTYTMIAGDGNDTQATSNSFTVSQVYPISLNLGTAPTGITANSPISPGITVTEMQNGGILTGDSDSSVTLAVTSAPAGGAINGTLTRQLTNGQVTFTGLTPTVPGVYTITASDGTDVIGQLSFSVAAPAITNLVFTQQPASFTLGPNVPVPTFQVSVEQNGVVQDVSDAINALLYIPSFGAYTPRTVNAVHGVATFSNFFVGTAIPSTLEATDSTNANAIPGISQRFNVSPGPTTYFSIPTLAPATAGTTATVTVQAQDGSRNFTPSYGGVVTLTITDSNGHVVATPTATAQSGIATFNVVLDQAGSYQLQATGTGASGSGSGSLTITAATPSQLAFILQPGNGAAGFAIEPPPSVAVEDQFGNLVTTDNSQVTLSIASPAGNTLGGVVTVAAQNGVATFNGVSISQIGTYTIQATDGNDTPVTSNSFNIGAPATIYVDQHATGASNGQSWLNAFTTLQQALAIAVDGDTIDVAQGDYTLAAADPTATFQLIDGVTIQGGFATGGSNSPNAAAHPTTLDGTANHYHVVTGTGTDSTAALEGFTITGGNAMGGGGTNSDTGAGVIVDGGSPSIGDCTITGNNAVAGGGIFAADGASLTLTSDTLSGNSAAYTPTVRGNGGGILIARNSTVNLVASTLNGNSADLGGGIEEDATSTLTLTNCTLAGNSAGETGGAIDAQGSVTITDSTLSGNSANYAGGIYAANGGALNGSIVDGNIGLFAAEDDLDGGLTGSHNIVGVDYSGSFANGVNNNLVGVTPAQLLLGPLASNGGPTQTMALLAGSPAIGAGSTFNGSDGLAITTDERGISRPATGTDIGAYQSAGPLIISGQYVYLENDGSGNLDWWVRNSAFTVNPLETVTPNGAIPIANLSAGIQVFGTDGNDQLTIDFSNGDPLPATGVSYDGGAGINTFAVVGTPGDDTLTVGPSGASFTSSLAGAVPLSLANVQGLQMLGGTGGNDAINLAGGSYTVNADTPSGTPNVSVLVGPGGAAMFSADQHLAALNINGGTATGAAATRTLLSADSVSISGGGTLDIGDSELLTHTDPTTIKAYLAAGYDAVGNQDWSQPGLTSSIARNGGGIYTVAYAFGGDQSAQDAGITTHAGAPLGANQTIVRATLTGDVNMDGKVDFFDISQLLGYKYNTSQPASYTDGDADYSGKVDFFDLSVILSANYNSGQTFAPAEARLMSAFAAAPAPPAAAAAAAAASPAPQAASAEVNPVTSSKLHSRPAPSSIGPTVAPNPAAAAATALNVSTFSVQPIAVESDPMDSLVVSPVRSYFEAKRRSKPSVFA
jgi:hypothetical protein